MGCFQNEDLRAPISPEMIFCLSTGLVYLQSWTKVLTHLSKTNAFYPRPCVNSKNIFVAHWESMCKRAMAKRCDIVLLLLARYPHSTAIIILIWSSWIKKSKFFLSLNLSLYGVNLHCLQSTLAQLQY